jgi:hypothetical protein
MTDKHSQNDIIKSISAQKLDDLIRPFIVPPKQQIIVPSEPGISLTKDYDPAYKANHLKKSKAKSQLKEGY